MHREDPSKECWLLEGALGFHQKVSWECNIINYP